jgi:hypothetical protein
VLRLISVHLIPPAARPRPPLSAAVLALTLAAALPGCGAGASRAGATPDPNQAGLIEPSIAW